MSEAAEEAWSQAWSSPGPPAPGAPLPPSLHPPDAAHLLPEHSEQGAPGGGPQAGRRASVRPRVRLT